MTDGDLSSVVFTGKNEERLKAICDFLEAAEIEFCVLGGVSVAVAQETQEEALEILRHAGLLKP